MFDQANFGDLQGLDRAGSLQFRYGPPSADDLVREYQYHSLGVSLLTRHTYKLVTDLSKLPEYDRR